MRYYRFRSIHTVKASTEVEAREILKKEVEDFLNNAIVIDVEEINGKSRKT